MFSIQLSPFACLEVGLQFVFVGRRKSGPKIYNTTLIVLADSRNSADRRSAKSGHHFWECFQFVCKGSRKAPPTVAESNRSKRMIGLVGGETDASAACNNNWIVNFPLRPSSWICKGSLRANSYPRRKRSLDNCENVIRVPVWLAGANRRDAVRRS